MKQINGSYSAAIYGGEEECSVREQDRFMPIANIIRIMRKILPLHAKISDDAKETIQECVSEYISFITSEANDRCQREQRKTITAEDVLYAMNKLGFDEYVEPLTHYLHRYREVEGERGPIRPNGEPIGTRRNGNISKLRISSDFTYSYHAGIESRLMGAMTRQVSGACSSQGGLENGQVLAKHKGGF